MMYGETDYFSDLNQIKGCFGLKLMDDLATVIAQIFYVNPYDQRMLLYAFLSHRILRLKICSVLLLHT